MYNKETLANICKSHISDWTQDLIDKIFELIKTENFDQLKTLVGNDLYEEIIAAVNCNQLRSEIIDFNENLEIHKSIPEDLYIDNINRNKFVIDEDISILNFLNNEADINDNVEVTIEDKMNLIFDLLEKNRIILIQGDTGCGKTTKIPRYLLEKYKSIICTQPRRIAAISIAKKVAQDIKDKVGNLVGYTVRFEDCTSKNTKLRYVTDGILIREIIQKNNLSKYDCIIIDEAHERTLNVDILLAYCKNMKSDTRIVIMSATLSIEKFISYFNCPVVTIKHKRYPLKNYFLKQYDKREWLLETIKTVIQLYNTEPSGDILVFLTGHEDINEACNVINNFINQNTCKVYMIYSSMPVEEQELVFKTEKQRKIILSTNICETSITIDTIKFVVDSGRVKQLRHSSNLGMDILEVVMISKAQAKQRSGRAGRTSPGKVFRIYTKKEYEEMLDVTPPEILTTNVSNGILTIKSLGIKNIEEFNMIDFPTTDSVNDAMEYLFLIKAVDCTGRLTDLGRRVAHLPLDPGLSVSLLRSIDLGCLGDVSIIVSLLTFDQIFLDIKSDDPRFKKYSITKKSWYDLRGDFFMLLNIYKGWNADKYSYRFLKHNFLNIKNMLQARKIRDQLLSYFKVPIRYNERNIMEAFSTGYFMNLAKCTEEGYVTVFKGTECFIHNSSCLYKAFPKYILYFAIVRTRKEYLKYCNEISPEILCRSANHIFKIKK